MYLAEYNRRCAHRIRGASFRIGFARNLTLSPGQQFSRWIPLVSRHPTIQSDAPRRNHTSVIPHLVGPTPDVGPADRDGSVAVTLSKCVFRGASLLNQLEDLNVLRIFYAEGRWNRRPAMTL
jgi:hypothetical protein